MKKIRDNATKYGADAILAKEKRIAHNKGAMRATLTIVGLVVLFLVADHYFI